MAAICAYADDTAYQALKAARATSGTESLVEMTGERGEPQPQSWKLVFNDPAARGGIREIVASGDVIVSQRTPLRGYTGVGSAPSVNFSRLNLDSDGAFKLANKQAGQKQIGFDWIDYTLRPNSDTGAPMWIVKLYNHMGSQVAMMQISAEDGSIISPLTATAVPPTEKVRTTEVAEETTVTSSDSKPPGGLIGRMRKTIHKTGSTIGNTTLRTIGSVQEFLVGERTIGPKDDN